MLVLFIFSQSFTMAHTTTFVDLLRLFLNNLFQSNLQFFLTIVDLKKQPKQKKQKKVRIFQKINKKTEPNKKPFLKTHH